MIIMKMIIMLIISLNLKIMMMIMLKGATVTDGPPVVHSLAQQTVRSMSIIIILVMTMMMVLVISMMLMMMRGILWEISDRGSKVGFHQGRKCGTVWNGQNGQKCPLKVEKTVGPFSTGVKMGGALGVKRVASGVGNPAWL